MLFSSSKAKQIISLATIVALFVLLFVELYQFIPSFLGALVLYIIFSPVMNFLINNLKLNKNLAALFIILISILLIAVPTIFLTEILFVKVVGIVADNDVFQQQLHQINLYVEQNLHVKIFNYENILKVQSYLTSVLSSVLNETFTILLNLGILFFLLFYMLKSWKDIDTIIEKYLPYKKENAKLFAKELVSQTHSNVIISPLVATLQGLLSAIVFWSCQLPEPFFWGVMCGFLSFVPFVGTALIWLPAGLIQLSLGLQWQGIVILIFGSLVITSIDNVFRFMLQKKIANVHPLITVFGVIVGLNLFKLPGIIFGPLLISYLILMIKVYRIEYLNSN